MRREARGHIGPLYFTPRLFLKELGVDSNVFNAAGEQKSDFTFTVAPKADVWVPVARRALFKATRRHRPRLVRDIRSERSVDPQFAAAARSTSAGSRSSPRGEYLNTRQRPNYEIDLRSRHLENNATRRRRRAADAEALGRGRAAASTSTRFDADAHFDGTSLQRDAQPRTTGFRSPARTG